MRSQFKLERGNHMEIKTSTVAVRDVSIELVQLQDKMNKLEALLDYNDQLTKQLPKEQINLLSSQLEYMLGYYNTLINRIELMIDGDKRLKGIYKAIVLYKF